MSGWPAVALAIPKSITFGTGTPSSRHQNIGRLDVAVDYPLLMRVLDRLADLDKQVETRPGGELASSQYSVIFTPRTSSITK